MTDQTPPTFVATVAPAGAAPLDPITHVITTSAAGEKTVLPIEAVTQHIEPQIMTVAPTQTAYPWRATLRTIFAALVAGATVIPVVITQQHWDSTAIGAQIIVVAGVITRVMAIPGVDSFLQKFAPFLATTPKETPA